MSSNLNPIQTITRLDAQCPSRIVLPASASTAAHVRGIDLGTGTTFVAATTVARERAVFGGAVSMPIPGPTTWSPPPS